MSYNQPSPKKNPYQFFDPNQEIKPITVEVLKWNGLIIEVNQTNRKAIIDIARIYYRLIGKFECFLEDNKITLGKEKYQEYEDKYEECCNIYGIIEQACYQLDINPYDYEGDEE